MSRTIFTRLLEALNIFSAVYPVEKCASYKKYVDTLQHQM